MFPIISPVVVKLVLVLSSFRRFLDRHASSRRSCAAGRIEEDRNHSRKCRRHDESAIGGRVYASRAGSFHGARRS